MGRKLKSEDTQAALQASLPAGVMTAEAGEPACERCGARLTVTHLGVIYPCGHDPKKQSFGQVYEQPEQRPGKVQDASTPTRSTQTPPQPENASTSPSGAANGHQVQRPDMALGDVMGQTVTVTWGKELYSPRQFHTLEVGPFQATVPVLPGETIETAMVRAMTDLRRFAEGERARKRASYEASLKGG